MTFDVAIIGGGISGLASAYTLKQQGYRVVVLERQQRAGGNAVSERIGGFLMEHGPSTLNALSDTANRFSSDLGLDGERHGLGDMVRKRYLVDGGRLRGIGVHPLAFLMSGYLSLAARARLMAEFAVPQGPRSSGETVRDFCVRRLGAEFADRVIDPLVGGIYSGKASELSMAAVFPKLLDLEQQHGSITAGLFRRRRAGGKMPGSRLFSWTGGTATLPRALARQLGGAVRTGIAVRRIQHEAGGYRIDTGASGAFSATAVIVATQPHVAAQLLDRVDTQAADAARDIGAPPLAVAFLGYRRDQVEHPLDGLGFLLPQSERRDLVGAQFCSTMFPGRAPEDHVAVAGYIGGARSPHLARLAPGDLIELARAEFGDLIGARGDPVVAQVRQWPRGLPQYRLGHERLRAELQNLPVRHPGLFATGNYFTGPSMAVCLDQAMTTAQQVGRFLASAGSATASERAGTA